jgi:DNA-directed RNA polymerase sigma subunit (sigma70/sigma32)|tara:strand:+ start:845 stop:1072 length:228 start_codon:yes stop_codon:yes gene_type:complete
MKKCLETCHKLSVACPVKECRYWIDYKAEKNCTFESVRENGDMTLREVADRLGVSYVRVKQIQDKTLKKISHLLK